MTTSFTTPRLETLDSIRTTFSRVRCPQPSRLERIEQSLQRHGQLSPVVVVRRQGGLELIDGFKRRQAALNLGWTTVLVTEASLDETAQWATMLLLNNRGAQSMAELEEALVLRELVATGLTQVEIAALVDRHKSWVSRRIGLIQRLHPELIEAVKLGVLHPGVARRLLSLPPGNQLQLAATAQRSRLGPHETELLVSLWYKATDEASRKELLADPRRAIARQYPACQRSPLDSNLSPTGQRLLRFLRVIQATASQLTRLLDANTPVCPADLKRLGRDLNQAQRAMATLACRLGSAASTAGGAGAGASSATS